MVQSAIRPNVDCEHISIRLVDVDNEPVRGWEDANTLFHSSILTRENMAVSKRNRCNPENIAIYPCVILVKFSSILDVCKSL